MHRFYSKKGLILNMGSFAGAAPTPMLAVYSGSKAYLHTWSDALTAEMAPKGVVVEHVNTYYVVRRVLLYMSLFSLSPPTLAPSSLLLESGKDDHDERLTKRVSSADFGYVENPPRVALRSNSKSIRARRARQARARHHHAVLDPRTDGRSHGIRAAQGGARVHPLAFEGYQEARPRKTGKACEARIETWKYDRTWALRLISIVIK
jgi:NAD(P)-dependent dehydrogenase (short-subunit alcohol dehydrogenase family)